MANRPAACALLAALCPSLLLAATLTVTVKDPGNAVIADATVSVKPSTSAALPDKKTDNQGRAVFDSLSAGSYLVTIAKQGFDTYKGEIPIGTQAVALPVSLKLSMLSTSVKVSGRRSPLANSDPNYIALRTGKLGEVYPVQDFTLTRDVGTFTFRSGSFSFEPEVMGRRTIGVFVGDGHFHLKPAFDLAAKHLQKMTRADEVDEDFSALAVYFSDSTFDEIKQHSEPADDPAEKHEAALKRVNAILQKRRTPSELGGYGLTKLEQLLNYQDIPNYDAEVLAEVYNNEKPGSFRAFIHGKKHEDLRFVLNPHGALPMMQAPEEVALLNFDPASNATLKNDTDGLWYMAHTLPELEADRWSSNEDKRLIAPEHYKIESFIGHENFLGNRPDLNVICTIRFHPLQDGVRMVKFDLVPDLQMQRVAFGGTEISFVQESRSHDGSFYLQMPQALSTGHSYEVTFEYKGGEILQSSLTTGNAVMQRVVGVPLRRVWYPMPSGPASRATYDLLFHIPRNAKVVAVGKLAREEREEGYNVSEWVTDVPIEQAIFRMPEMDCDPVSRSETEPVTGTPMTVYTGFSTPGFAPNGKGALDKTGQILALYSTWFGRAPYDHLSVVEGGMMDALPGLAFVPPFALDGPPSMGVFGVQSGLQIRMNESYPALLSREWWGNLLSPASFHDQWLVAGLVNFSTSLFDTAANNDYSGHWSLAHDALLGPSRWGAGVANSQGPVWMGMLNDTTMNAASSVLNASKGGFVVQMLRGMMWDPKTGDHDFQAMLQYFVTRFANQRVSTENFQETVEKHMKPAMDVDGNHRMDWFFREWLYSTDVPSYRLEYSVKIGEKGALTLEGKLTQSGVSPDFRMIVPVFGEFAGGKMRICSVVIRGNSTGNFEALLPARPKRILLNINHDVLTGKDEVVAVK